MNDKQLEQTFPTIKKKVEVEVNKGLKTILESFLKIKHEGFALTMKR